ncbi:MAG: YbaN family protein [Acidobacteriota bacterium]
MTSAHTSTTLSRVIYGGLGWCAVALAFAGVFVPGLPVTVFVLIASWFFARSSPRFESYLRTNRWFGPRLQRFQGSGGMPRSAKIAALVCMWTAIGISSTVLASVSIGGSLITIVLGGIGTLTIVLAVRTVAEPK